MDKYEGYKKVKYALEKRLSLQIQIMHLTFVQRDCYWLALFFFFISLFFVIALCQNAFLIVCYLNNVQASIT